MREIEFRAWDQCRNTMFTNSRNVEFKIVNGVVSAVNYDWSGKEQALRVMQYTGLKDANSVKIFEGDIIRHREGYVWTVIYESAESRFALVCKPPLIRPLSSTRSRNVKVIGNIYENPELLATEGSL
tara:strand:+ start:602 stop:982 length:381 start_codon:yes stop_codon:yes gene_type:complete